MSTTLRASAIRAASGGAALLLALGTLFVLKDARGELNLKRKAKEEATRSLQSQEQRLADLKKRADVYRLGKQTLQELQERMPQGSPGELQWQLSKVLHELSQKHGVRLQNIKYAQAAKEGSKGLELEAIEANFTVLGVYGNLKPFMLALEGSNLPFAVKDANLEESPEGARLTVNLRAFRRTGRKAEGEEA